MPEPTKAEIAKSKKIAGQAILANTDKLLARHRTEPKREDYGLSADFDFEEFDAFIRQRDGRSLILKLAAFSSIAAFLIHFLPEYVEKRSFLTLYIFPISLGYFLVFVLPFLDYALRSLYGDQAYIDSAYSFRRALQTWNHFHVVSGEGYWRGLRGTDLEWAVARVFREQGWEVRTTPSTGDGGIDLVLQHANARFFCQCKGHAKPVSVAAVREIAGVCAASDAIPMLIAVNGLTGPASKEAQDLSVIAWDSAKLAAFARGDLALS